MPIVWIVFIGLSLLTSVQGWTLRPAARSPSDEESKDERPERNASGYGAIEPTSEEPQKPIFTVVEAKTRAQWLDCIGIRVEGEHPVSRSPFTTVTNDRTSRTVFVDEQGYDMADEVDKYDEKDVSVHFVLYAQDDPESARRGEKGVPAGTIRTVKDSLKVGPSGP